MNIELRELPKHEVAYVRKVGSYLDTGDAWTTLIQWVNHNGINTKYQNFIGISLDDPAVVKELDCRYDACVTIPNTLEKKANDDVQFRKLSGGLYAVYHFYDTTDKLAIAFKSIFGQWLPDSEYDADDRECLEFCLNNPAEDPEGKCKTDIYIPIKKRS